MTNPPVPLEVDTMDSDAVPPVIPPCTMPKGDAYSTLPLDKQQILREYDQELRPLMLELGTIGKEFLDVTKDPPIRENTSARRTQICDEWQLSHGPMLFSAPLGILSTGDVPILNQDALAKDRLDRSSALNDLRSPFMPPKLTYHTMTAMFSEALGRHPGHPLGNNCRVLDRTTDANTIARCLFSTINYDNSHGSIAIFAYGPQLPTSPHRQKAPEVVKKCFDSLIGDGKPMVPCFVPKSELQTPRTDAAELPDNADLPDATPASPALKSDAKKTEKPILFPVTTPLQFDLNTNPDLVAGYDLLVKSCPDNAVPMLTSNPMRCSRQIFKSDPTSLAGVITVASSSGHEVVIDTRADPVWRTILSYILMSPAISKVFWDDANMHMVCQTMLMPPSLLSRVVIHSQFWTTVLPDGTMDLEADHFAGRIADSIGRLDCGEKNKDSLAMSAKAIFGFATIANFAHYGVDRVDCPMDAWYSGEDIPKDVVGYVASAAMAINDLSIASVLFDSMGCLNTVAVPDGNFCQFFYQLSSQLNVTDALIDRSMSDDPITACDICGAPDCPASWIRDDLAKYDIRGDPTKGGTLFSRCLKLKQDIDVLWAKRATILSACGKKLFPVLQTPAEYRWAINHKDLEKFYPIHDREIMISRAGEFGDILPGFESSSGSGNASSSASSPGSALLLMEVSSCPGLLLEKNIPGLLSDVVRDSLGRPKDCITIYYEHLWAAGSYTQKLEPKTLDAYRTTRTAFYGPMSNSGVIDSPKCYPENVILGIAALPEVLRNSPLQAEDAFILVLGEMNIAEFFEFHQ